MSISVEYWTDATLSVYYLLTASDRQMTCILDTMPLGNLNSVQASHTGQVLPAVHERCYHFGRHDTAAPDLGLQHNPHITAL